MAHPQPLIPLASNETDAVVACIAANADLSGVGVRVAFYLQSFMNALLVLFSPKESVSIAWAGTLLTVSVVIAGIVGKYSQTPSLTLHHATLILNFTTLSCISSLATAPMLPLWRMTHGEYFKHHRRRFAFSGQTALPLTRDDMLVDDDVYINVHKKRIKEEQQRGRLFIACAILFQVVSQWTWCIILFVSPQNYSQPECSGGTRLVMFLSPFETVTINDFENAGARFLVWPAWLLLCLGSTLCLSVTLSTAGPKTTPDTSQVTMAQLTAGGSPRTPVLYTLTRAARYAVASWVQKGNRLLLTVNFLAFFMWVVLITSSEWQRKINHVDASEDDIRGFGQITALLLAMAPGWSLWTAFNRYVAVARREQKRRRVAEDGRSPVRAPPPPPLLVVVGPSAAAEAFELEPMTSRAQGSPSMSASQLPEVARNSEDLPLLHDHHESTATCSNR